MNNDYVLPDHARGGNELLTRPDSPLEDWLDAGKRLGMGKGFLDHLRQRHHLASGDGDVDEMFGGKLTAEDTIKLLDRSIKMGFAFVDPSLFAKASLQQLVTSIAIMIDKKQLVSGEPTHILSHAERKDINELMPLVLAECIQRGITVQSHVEEGKSVVTVMKDVN